MLAPASERIEDSLARISPDDRALLELSLRRGVSDDEIANLLHVHREHVEHRREMAMERLSLDLGIEDRAEVAALIGQTGRVNGDSVPAPRRRALDRPVSPEADARTRRRRVRIAVALVAAALLVVAIGLANAGDDPSIPAPKPAPPAPAPPAAGPRVELTPLVPGGSARGSARLRGSRLELTVSGLPAGSYAAWLFDDISSARMVARFDGPRAVVEAKLPRGFQSRHFVDVSREPADGNPNHSGASVLRVPLARLLSR